MYLAVGDILHIDTYSKVIPVLLFIYALFFLYYQNTISFPLSYPQPPISQEVEKIIKDNDGTTFVFSKELEEEPLVLRTKINNYCEYKCQDLANPFSQQIFAGSPQIFIRKPDEADVLPESNSAFESIYRSDAYEVLRADYVNQF